MQFTRFLSAVAGLSLVSATSVAPKNFNDTAPIAASARAGDVSPRIGEASPKVGEVTPRVGETSANISAPVTSFAPVDSYAPLAANVTEGPSSWVTVETIVTPTVIGNHTFYTTSLHTVTICTRCEEESRLEREMIQTAVTTVCDVTCQTLSSIYREAAKTTTYISCDEGSPAVVHTFVTTICDEVCQSIMSRASASLTTSTQTVRPVSTHVTTVRAEPAAHTTSTVFVTPKSTIRTTVETRSVVRSETQAPARSMVEVQTANGAAAKYIDGKFAAILAVAALLL